MKTVHFYYVLASNVPYREFFTNKQVALRFYNLVKNGGKCTWIELYKMVMRLPTNPFQMISLVNSERGGTIRNFILENKIILEWRKEKEDDN